MKHKLLFLFAALLAMFQPIWAYDFSYTYQGKTLYYTITDSYNHQVSVVNITNDYNHSNYVTGNVIIPDSVDNNGTMYAVISIGVQAFSDCIGLTSVTIPNSVTAIGNYAFHNCTGLTSVTIGNSVTVIGPGAFVNCIGLTSVTIPNSVTTIDHGAFSECRGLISVTIPNSVTVIGRGAFLLCTSLTSVTIPNSVTTIGNAAFEACHDLTSATIPSSVTSIGDFIFASCESLTSIVVDSGNTHYDSRNNCNAIIQTDLNMLVQGCMTTVIPNSVTTIGNNAFNGCTSLTSVTIPSSVTTIGNQAFSSCTGLTSVTIPSSVTSIGEYVFSSCTGLTSVTIGNSVTTIDNSAFNGCTSLTSVTIPSSVTTIGNNAFEHCTGLLAVYCKPIIPPATSYNGFYNINNCQIYVPCTSVSAYQSAPYWSDYSSRIHGMPFDWDYTFIFSSNNDTMGTVNVGSGDCDNNITVTATAKTGYQFNGWSDGGTGNPRTFHLTSDTTVTAIFGIMTYTIIAQPNIITRGSVTVTGNDTLYYGDSVTLAATANYGYHFQRWQDNNTQNPRTVVVTQNRTYTAYFQPNTYTVTVHSADSSQGTVSGSGTVNYMSNRTLHANPATGYHFSHWSDGDSNATRTISVAGDTTLTAFFEINSYQLTVLPNDSTLGTVTGSGIYTHGTQVTVTATPTIGNRFDHWSDNTLLSSYTFPLTGSLQLVAIFMPADTVFVHDTTYITLIDTLIVYDTAIVDNYIHDTTFVYDTTLVTDTIWLTDYLHDTVYLPQYIYDTVYIHDTVYVSIDEVDMLDAKIYARNGQIVVESGDGMPLPEVRVFDALGRMTQAIKQSDIHTISFTVQASGTYLVKIGNYPARRIVVIR